MDDFDGDESRSHYFRELSIYDILPSEHDTYDVVNDTDFDWMQDEDTLTANENDESDDKLSVSYSELLDMFDFSSVLYQEDLLDPSTSIKRKVVKVPKMVMTVTGEVSLVEQQFLQYYESTIDLERTPKPKLTPLPLIHGCRTVDSNTLGAQLDDFPTMPSLKLNLSNLNRGYTEPSRDRDKDWVLDSQRQVLDAPLPAGQTLSLGKYEELKATPLEWLTPMQSLLRRKCLVRQVVMVSESLCVVSVIGLGIAGRLVSNGVNAKRMILIEAYCCWNSTVYTLNITISRLKSLFTRRSALLEPGKKKLLLQELLKLLYFEYTLVLPPIPPERVTNKEIEQTVRVIKVSHLDDPKIPPGYPPTIIDVITAITDMLPLPDITLPQLHQKLCISDRVRETAAQRRRWDEAERRRRELEEEERRRKAWFAVPKRIRGLVYARCTRQHGKLFILEAYKFPSRPTICSVRSLVTDECAKMTLSLVLPSVSKLFKLPSNPMSWADRKYSVSDELSKKVCSGIIKSILINGIHRPTLELYVNMKDRRGAAVELRPLKSALSLGEGRTSVARLRKLRRLDRLSAQHVLWGRNTSACGVNSYRQMMCIRVPIAPPRREIGRGKRVATRVVSIVGVRGIFTLYYRIENPIKKKSKVVKNELEMKVIDQPQVPSKSNLTGEFDQDRVPHVVESMGAGIIVELEIYIPYGTEMLGASLAPHSLFRVEFQRLDIIRITEDLEAIEACFRSLSDTFFDSATDEEVKRSEDGWNTVLLALARSARWALSVANEDSVVESIGDKERIHKLSYSRRVREVEKLLYFDSMLVTNELGGQVEPTFDAERNRQLEAERIKVAKKHSRPPRSSAEEGEGNGEGYSSDPELDDSAWDVDEGEDLSAGGREAGQSLEEDQLMADFNARGRRRFSNQEPDITAAARQSSKDLDSSSTDRNTDADEKSRRERSQAHIKNWNKPTVFLRWSAVIMGKVQKVASDADDRPSPTMQVVMWQKGKTLGVVGYDHERLHIYTAQPRWKTQKLFLEEVQAMSVQERNVNILVFLADLEYYETGPKDEIVGNLRFVDQSLKINVVEKDYRARADKATDKAAEAARARTQVTSGLGEKKTQAELDAAALFLRNQLKKKKAEVDDEDLQFQDDLNDESDLDF